MISRIDAERTAVASVHSNYDGKIVEMLGKIELNVSGLVGLRRETTELLNTTRTDIEADLEQKISTIRGELQEIIHSSTVMNSKIDQKYSKSKWNSKLSTWNSWNSEL